MCAGTAAAAKSHPAASKARVVVSTAPVAGTPIFAVVLEPHEVFHLDKAKGPEKLLRLADSFHVRTRDGIIRRELLFAPGDPYDPAILAETERAMRLLPLFRKVEIEGVKTSSGTVVIVRTWDAWSLAVVADFKRSGGANTAVAGIGENNLMGSGKAVNAAYNQTGPTVSRTASYHDPLFLRQKLDFQTAAVEASESRSYSLALARPFYSSLTRWSLSGGGDYSDSPATAWEGINQAGTVERRYYDANLTYGYAYHPTSQRTLRLTAGLLQRRADYEAYPTSYVPAAAFVPGTEQHTDVSVGGEYQELTFIKERRIQKLSRVEDLNLGWDVLPSLTYGPGLRALGATGSELIPRLTVRKVFGTEYYQYVALRGDYSSAYINGGNGLQLTTIDAQYFLHFEERHTLAAHLAVNNGWRLDGPSQLSLGEINGLRGYRNGQFIGNRSVLISTEDRIFFAENIWKLVDAGGVVFVDSGYAWMPDQGMHFSDLKTSVGVGLRLAATRSSANVPLRIDVAKALNDNNSPNRWTLSILAGASFGPN
jgi:outer membrane protein assembly factor BamA